MDNTRVTLEFQPGLNIKYIIIKALEIQSKLEHPVEFIFQDKLITIESAK